MMAPQSTGRPRGAIAGRAPKYRLHKATGQARVTLGGKDIYLGEFNSRKSRAEYDRIVGEWLMKGRQQANAKSTWMTVSELLAARMAHLAAQGEAEVGSGQYSISRLFVVVARLLRREYGSTTVDKFGPLAFRTMIERMKTEPMQSRGRKGYWSRQYIIAVCKEIRALFKWGVSMELVPVPVADALRTVESVKIGTPGVRESAPVKPIDDHIVDATIAHTTPTIAAMINLQRMTGARPGEICVMRACDIDMTDDAAWYFRPHKHKLQHVGRGRVIPLVGDAIEIVRGRLKANMQAYIFTPEESAKERDAIRLATNKSTPAELARMRAAMMKRRRGAGVKPKQFNERYTERAYSRAIRYATCLAFPAPLGLDESQRRQWVSQHAWAPNRLRHNAATRVRAENGLEAAKDLLGHANERMTLRYAEPDLKKIAKTAATLAG